MIARKHGCMMWTNADVDATTACLHACACACVHLIVHVKLADRLHVLQGTCMERACRWQLLHYLLVIEFVIGQGLWKTEMHLQDMYVHALESEFAVCVHLHYVCM